MTRSQPDTLLTAARQTMDAWSKVIASQQEVPDLYQKPFAALFQGAQRFPHVILTPSLVKFPKKTTEKLICDTGESLHIFENQDGQVITISFTYADVYSIEVGSILLDSWLTLRGMTARGVQESVTIHVNTTSLRYFTGILTRLRPQPRAEDISELSVEKEKFNGLAGVNFKFMNYARESLVPGESVLHVLYQSEVRRSLWPPVGMLFSRLVTPAHVLILTDRELILIQDVERSSRSTAQYGAIWQYLPLDGLRSAALARPANGCVSLVLEGKAGTFERIFDLVNIPQLEELCARLQALIAVESLTL